ncbi:hypothetical protein [Chitinivorax sp. B]|uniref:hypothetical protein n=1 Tax=Chitinivorax sp. B TaxID=2502235 RepID=UPI001485B40F|nr:hypothetical protein [Chitinivorax sp. B]
MPCWAPRPPHPLWNWKPAIRAVRHAYQELPTGLDQTEKLEALDKAYAILADPVRRGIYDASLKSGTASQMEQSIRPTKPTRELPAYEGVELKMSGSPSDTMRKRVIIMLTGIVISISGMAVFWYVTGKATQQVGGGLNSLLENESLQEYAYRSRDDTAMRMMTRIERTEDRIWQLKQARQVAPAEKRDDYNQSIRELQTQQQAQKKALRERLNAVGAIPPP